MKRRGSELGQLSSRFFAYIHLKKKDIVHTGDLASVLGITKAQERDLLSRLSESGWIVRLKRGVYLAPPRLPAGGQYSPGIAVILQKLMQVQDGHYQICGPNAFYFYGFDDQLPNITYVYNDRISGSRAIGNLAFQFIKVTRIRLGSTHSVSAGDGSELVYSSKARTLMDAVYHWSRFNSLPRGYDWIRQETKKDPSLTNELVDITARYGNQATARRIGYLLDTLCLSSMPVKKLHRRLSNSRALIPWIPGKAARGKINRKWGVIVNG